jgi:hypothetical protein
MKYFGWLSPPSLKVGMRVSDRGSVHRIAAPRRETGGAAYGAD